ncbi:intermembrane lipid transfer protein Vps13D [Cydia fagiglandana]|uniref:intermembrane lipid transfer protein Vps13D n=1 Tax=Cydia fagiglandana TaxID=1458189 RepID=UPI002FEE3DBC
MLEGLVAWVLNNYLGKYVENLNTDQLSVALLSGKVELENLPLKKDALRHLGLPVEVRAGFIGKVQLQVPVRQIRSAPWLIAIEKLYLVAAPVNLDEWDSATEAHYAHERKVALLDALEAQWRAAQEAMAADASYYAASYSSWLSYGTGFLANIVENLQLKLNDVHIRYEDAVTCSPHAFACGLTAAALSAESCDASWKRGFTLLPTTGDGCSFKLLELQRLAVYWDVMPPNEMMADCSMSELTERMSQTWLGIHQWLLAPATATARVRRERTEQPLRSRTRPRLTAHLTLDTVLLNLTQRQYSEAVGCSLGLERIARLREFRSLRPAVPVRQGARLWWLYALRCHYPDHTWMEPAPTWGSCLAQARAARQYVEICLSLLSNPAATLPPDKKAAKDEFEWKTPLHLLKPLREIAMRRVPLATPVSTPSRAGAPGRSMLVQWFPQWWGWYGAPEPGAAPAAPPAAPPDLEEEILDVIADSLENNTMLKRDTVFGKFEFVLNKGCLNLCMEPEVENKEPSSPGSEAAVGLELQFSAVAVGLESRVRAGSHALHVSLGGVSLRERITPGSLFPVLVAPAPLGTRSSVGRQTEQEPLFQLLYEKRPFGLNADYKLWVKSAPLEVVYCLAAARWAQQWAAEPWGHGAGAARPYAAVRDHTRAKLITQWEHMLHPGVGERRSWQVELDISAPQILFVESLTDRDSSVLVLDFGRLRLANADAIDHVPDSGSVDDEEMFMTPCSTPPGSLLSPGSPPEPPAVTPAQPGLLAMRLHNRLYDRYTIEFSDLQILVGRARDNWKYAHAKTTSSLHLLDRFSISLQAERRVVHTTDPQYPTATLCGTLPALVVHLSEQKVFAVRSVIASSPLFATDASRTDKAEGAGADEPDGVSESSESSDTEPSSHSSHKHATLFMVQFAIDQMSLEVQSRGRSIAEVQVCGVKATATARPSELALALSVHSLLLVDALQTYGPDFELLVASHKHVGMDTASGSIRGSEPTSPTSPSSPDARAPPPHALQAALYSLTGRNPAEADRTSPGPTWPNTSWNTSYNTAWGSTSNWNSSNSQPWNNTGTSNWSGNWGGAVDSEALIAVELTLVKGENGSEDLRIANILFNNLDIIANQETIVELIGFTQRVFGSSGAKKPEPAEPPKPTPSTEDEVKEVRTEITFDFHRLGVLLLRAAVHDGAVVAKKIATATVSEARIQATVDASRVEVDGSLGGVQVVSLCEGAGLHTRVLSAGRAPAPAAMPDQRALLFTITRRVTADGEATTGVEASVALHVASVWVTHSSALLRELRSCLTEFKQYLANLARSIRAAAHDMAVGLVARGDTLYANPKISTSMEGVSPRRRTTSVGYSIDEPAEEINLTVNIELESPVVVVPRSALSPQVFVAHLGRMSLANRPRGHRAAYRVRVTDISLASVDVSSKLKQTTLSAESMPSIYDASGGKPVLHNTALQLAVHYGHLEPNAEPQCEVTGHVVGGLHVSARREQYEQLLDTIRYLSAADEHAPAPMPTQQYHQESMSVREMEPAVPTLRLDPALRAAVLAVPPPRAAPQPPHPRAQHVPLSGTHTHTHSPPTRARSTCRSQVHTHTHTHTQVEMEPAVPTLRLDPALRAAVLAVPPPRAASQPPHPRAQHVPLSEMEPAVPTLRLDPALRAAVLAVPPPRAASQPPHPRAQHVEMEPAVPTLRLDPALRAAVLAVPPPRAASQPPHPRAQHVEMEPAVPTLRLDPALRAAVLAVPPPRAAPQPPHPRAQHVPLSVHFELSSFTVELRADLGRGERSLVQLAFREFAVRLRRPRPHESDLHVSLHSVTMEDLTQDPESKHRMLLVSHAPHVPAKAVFVSKSCPDFGRAPRAARTVSLPSGLNVDREYHRSKRDSKCGPTPPCSPELGVTVETETADAEAEADAEEGAGDGLVNVTVRIRDPQHQNFHDLYNRVSRHTRVRFNCLKLVVSIDSWVAVLDFFGVAGEDADEISEPQPSAETSVSPSEQSPEEGTTQTEMSIRSLSVVLVGARGEVCSARALRLRANAQAHASAHTRSLRVAVGGLHLADLTPRAPLWRDRLRTHGDKALEILYTRLSATEAAEAGYETSLTVALGPATYVHTKRFIHELYAFAHDFRQLRRVIVQARQKVSVSVGVSPTSRQRLSVRCLSPVIVLPVSGRSRGALRAELTELTIDNCFRKAGDADTVSTRTDPDAGYYELLDVRTIRLEQLSVWCARGGRGLRVRRAGAPLLPAPARLLLQVERNLGDTHNVPDMTVQGTLATLQCALDPAQYRLVRGVLAHNLGECVADLPPHVPLPATTAPHHEQVWTTSSIKLDLLDVTVELEPEHGVSSLACINFIKSRLLLETYSDLSQDIDLVSQEILVSDTRYVNEPANRRGNVFTHIVQPMADHRHSVQAEVHARKRGDSSAYTILVNNMRLMAILDWWEAANQFIMQLPLPPCDPDQQHLEEALSASLGQMGAVSAGAGHDGQVELKLNVTDSQLVLVEDASIWDTNAVILKSTTVITYRVADAAKPVSCELNELEVFSCVLGLEEETALAIVDPAAVTVALHKDRSLHISTGTLNLRLSYHDMRMFASMIQSLPAQVRAALSGKTEEETVDADAPANSLHMRAGARLLPPRWLPLRAPPPQPSAVWPLRAVQVTAECVTLCVIDDCLDSDVPLLEVSLADLNVEQDLRKVEESFSDPVLVSTPCASSGAPGATGAGAGRLGGALSVHYYNRMLSGWEPAIEPWRFETSWEYTLTSGLALGRLAVSVRSTEVLNTNITSSLVELTQLVRANWTADYYTQPVSLDASPKGSPAGHRRRSPFVPYALRNHTGHKLWFTTLLTTCDVLTETTGWSGPDDSWVAVRGGDTEPFSFGARRGRGARAGPAVLHQLALRLDAWGPPDPVCVDRVGVFFRTLTHSKTGAEARLVLEVSLEGSARKLVTVRSALTLLNRLTVPVDVRLEPAPGQWSGGSGRWTSVAAGGLWAAPLSPQPGGVAARPALRGACPPAPAHVDWRVHERSLLHVECRAPPLDVYRFCCVVVRERFPPTRDPNAAGHALTLVPALRLENLLPLELQFRCSGLDVQNVSGALPPAVTRPFHEVNVEEGVELSVKIEGFGWSSTLSVGGAGGNSFTARLKLKDSWGRRLYLNARVAVKPTDGIKISISAAYWLVNRTGLPLVFRAEGATAPAAGQGDEHEVARMVAPLLFAFAEADGGPTVTARLGTGVALNQEWCSPFGLGPGTAVKKLTAGDKVYAVGVSVRAGRGRYRHTNIATLTPRYQLHNNTPYHLQFAQKCTATTLNDPGALATHVSAVAGCYLPWHWARWERAQLLCVRVLGAGAAPRTAWSGGLRVDSTRAVHIACRENTGGGGYVFLRVEVVAQGATLFVVLTHADSAPPPLRVDNHSPVAIMFHQVGCGEECVVGAHGSVQWALPEPEGQSALALRAPGGPRATLPLDALGTNVILAYQNFIYVAFDKSGSSNDDSILVLEVPLNSTRVILARKRYGDRGQLWRRGPNDQLIHEGSSPPQPTDALLTDEPTLSPHAMVLDIEGPAPRPGRAAPLVLRRADPRRASTQAWRLVGGRMACAHANLCVQPDGGLMALTQGSRVVLGLPDSSRGRVPLPPEQAVAWHTLRPGSGRLSVALSCAGPTRIVSIRDPQDPESGWIEGVETDSEAEEPPRREWEVQVALAGLSVSLIARSPAQELVHALLSGVLLRVAAARAAVLALSVQDMQWDNQLLGTPSPVLLYCLPGTPGSAGSAGTPALHAAAELMQAPARRYNALFFKHLVVALRPLAIRLEERLILKLWWWAAPPDDEAREEIDEADYETRRMLDEVTALHARRYYFALIKIIPSQIRLSMTTASKLERELGALKRRLGLTMIKFEDACVELEPFARAHVFEPAPYLARQMLKHFKDELKWQAAKILGSVDFLGNPLGFVADVSEGVSGLIYEGNVGALLKNVTHGISNSAAKVTESLGDGLERVVGDEAHEETRRRIRSSAAGAHLSAGLRGLGLGILGGMTSLVKHSYEGAAAEGLPGLLAGVGKGLVGTVTKPVIGVLDLAAETASALRDSARRADKWVPSRAREPRCAAGPGGLLPRYDASQAAGAALLHRLTTDPAEGFLAYRVVRDTPHDIRALLSTTHLRIFTCKHTQPQIVMETHLSNLVSCAAVTIGGAHFVELGVRGGGGGGGEALRRPRVQCDSAALAAWLASHAAYARRLHTEAKHTLPPDQPCLT